MNGAFLDLIIDHHYSILGIYKMLNIMISIINKMIDNLSKKNEDLRHRIKKKKQRDKVMLDANLKQYKLKQDIFGQLQEESLRKLARVKQRAVKEDVDDRAIHNILSTHQNNLKDLTDSIFVAKEENFKAAADTLHSKLSEIEARRYLDKKMVKKYQKQVRKIQEKEETRTGHFINEYQKIDYFNNIHNPYYIPPISGIGAMSMGNSNRKDMEMYQNDD
mmetsp:Transcript_32027/g.28392  ORF Transcript_32027/g.28392 Transcript_32027/m.28392 type:complete len:219 (+) Transcript_32027:126-782(+)